MLYGILTLFLAALFLAIFAYLGTHHKPHPSKH